VKPFHFPPKAIVRLQRRASHFPIRSTASCISGAEPDEVVELDVEF